MRIIDRCPSCGRKLYKQQVGLVCKNWKCARFWKRGVGFAFNLTSEEWEYHSREEQIRKKMEKYHKKYGKYMKNGCD